MTIGLRAAAAHTNDVVASNAAEALRLALERHGALHEAGQPLDELGRDMRDIGGAEPEVLDHLVSRPPLHQLPDDLRPRPVGGRPARLPGAAPQHRVAVVGGSFGDRLGQARLADPRLAGDEEQRALAAPRLGEGREQLVALGAPPDERRAAARLHSRLRGRRGDPRRRGERRILHEDRPLEVAELAGGLDAQLLGERVAGLTIGVERVGLAAGAIEREHQLRVETLAHRLGRDELLQLADQLAVAAGRQVGLDADLDRREPLLFEAGDLSGGERSP